MLPIEKWRADFDERSPIYQQIIEQFSRALVRGELIPGERIPSIRDLAVSLKVNTNTIQRAYQEMERDKTIYSQRGTGYFVTEDDKMVERIKDYMVRESTSRFLKEMFALGFDSQSILSELTRQIEKGDLDNAAIDSKGA